MNNRERFIATMHYQPRDRAPLFDFNFWDETIPEWKKQGLPGWVTQQNAAEFFGLDISLAGGDGHWNTRCDVGLFPAFDDRIL